MANQKKLGIVMDPIQSIPVKKDTSFAMLLEAARRGYELYYFEQKNLFVRDGKAFGHSRLLQVFNNEEHWYALSEPNTMMLSDLDVILMRKDPPFDLEYIYTTYILELAEAHGVKVINKPQSLRDFNEKMAVSWFPQCSPPTLVTNDVAECKAFFQEHKDIICKPLEGKGGSSVFRLQYSDVNANVVMEVLSQQGHKFMMAQRYIPEITQGDKRILMIYGEPIPYALARIPAEGEWRGNMAVGAKGVAQPLTKRDHWICEEVGPILREKGLAFVGLDVIGDFLTEINVTSPTGIQELDRQCNLNIAATFFDAIDK